MASRESDTGGYSAKPFQLRPSALSSPNTAAGNSCLSGLDQQSKSFVLRPSALTSIADQIETGDTRKRQAKAGDTSDDETDGEGQKRPKLSESSDDEKLRLTEPIEKPKGIGTFGFGEETAVNGTSNGNDSNEKEQNEASCGFVFGQNIAARVTGFKDLPSEPETKEKPEQESSLVSETEKERLLMEAADEHMQNISKNKQQLHEVETFTGEEGERNVLMVQCKLHLFDSIKKIWCEKGRGTVKLNDICQSEKFGVFQSRLVFRTQGSHLVVFNTKLWPQMKCEKASEKSMRITAMDSDVREVKIYLISAPSKDIHQLFTAIDRRIQALKRNQESLPSSVDESCDSNDNESRVADDEDSRSEDTRSSTSHSLDQTHHDEDPEQSNDSCSDPQDPNKERQCISPGNKDGSGDSTGT